MMLSGGRLEAVDLIRPLSLESLQYFADGHDNSTMNGKFVRVGKTIMMGVAMEYDPLDRFGVHRKLEHLDLVRQLQQDEDAFKTALIESITESCLANNPTRINDAGLTIMMFDSARQPSELLMIGDSGYFGRANSEGRQHTIQIAQAAVGPTVMVGQ